MNCPVCYLPLSQQLPSFCPQCAWDLKNDLGLNMVISDLPQVELDIYHARLALAQKNWRLLQQKLHLQPVSALDARLVNDAIHLSWNWPADATVARVAISHGTFPTDDQHQAVTVVRSGSETTARFEYKPQEKGVCYFAVFTALPDLGLLSLPAVVSAGSTTTEQRVYYRIHIYQEITAREAHTRVVLTLKCDVDIHLAPMVLVGKSRNIPIQACDGITLLHLHAITIINGLCEIDIPAQYQGQKLYAKLFFESVEDARHIRLLPAKMDHLLIP